MGSTAKDKKGASEFLLLTYVQILDTRWKETVPRFFIHILSAYKVKEILKIVPLFSVALILIICVPKALC